MHEERPDKSAGGAVTLRSVVKRFGDATAVDGIDLEVRPGEFLSLLGPSGCGKTTTLRMLAGFEEPDEGEILLAGEPITDVPPHKRDVNTVFQAYALFPHMTVAENVAYGLRQKRIGRKQMRQRVGEALDMVRMTPLANRKPRAMSGGQQQRVAVARALVNRPSVLLLDEPLGALDRKLREEMQIELKLIQSQLATTFIFVTHDQHEALAMSDRIAVMLNGRIEQIDEPDTIYERPVSAFVAGFVGQQNFFRGRAGADGSVATSDVVLTTARDVPESVTPGAAALASVRPESITIAEGTTAAASNAVTGTLASVAHLGDVLQYVVIAGDKEVIARVPRFHAKRVEVGASVTCSWDSEDVHLFDAGQADLVLADPSEATS